MEGSGVYTLPRKHLIQGIKVAVQSNILRLPPGTPESKIITGELASLALTTKSAGHDDLALWRARKVPLRGKELDRVLPHF